MYAKLYKFIKYLFLVFVMNCNFSIAFESKIPLKNPPFIETERLLLRLIDVKDVNDIYEFTSDPEMSKLTALFSLHKNLEETKTFIEKSLQAYEKSSWLPLAIVYKENNKVIGLLNILAYFPAHSRAEIAYVVSRNYWNKGFATEAASALVGFAFNELKLNRIQATFDPRNIKSRRVLEKLNFKYEGLLRDYYYVKNEFCDRIMFSILKREFKN